MQHRVKARDQQQALQKQSQGSAARSWHGSGHIEACNSAFPADSPLEGLMVPPGGLGFGQGPTAGGSEQRSGATAVTAAAAAAQQFGGAQQAGVVIASGQRRGLLGKLQGYNGVAHHQEASCVAAVAAASTDGMSALQPGGGMTCATGNDISAGQAVQAEEAVQQPMSCSNGSDNSGGWGSVHGAAGAAPSLGCKSTSRVVRVTGVAAPTVSQNGHQAAGHQAQHMAGALPVNGRATALSVADSAAVMAQREVDGSPSHGGSASLGTAAAVAAAAATGGELIGGRQSPASPRTGAAILPPGSHGNNRVRVSPLSGSQE